MKKYYVVGTMFPIIKTLEQYLETKFNPITTTKCESIILDPNNRPDTHDVAFIFSPGNIFNELFNLANNYYECWIYSEQENMYKKIPEKYNYKKIIKKKTT